MKVLPNVAKTLIKNSVVSYIERDKNPRLMKDLGIKVDTKFPAMVFSY